MIEIGAITKIGRLLEHTNRLTTQPMSHTGRCDWPALLSNEGPVNEERWWVKSRPARMGDVSRLRSYRQAMEPSMC